jgi:glycosyltransferase involved in cell wall biosynthesis
MSDLVSVTIPFLNAERFLEEAVGSIRSQTYADWELLLVDDGSTDASTELARAFAAAEPGRIRYLEHPGHVNRGMAATRNLGLRHSRGEYIARLDADDRLEPTHLERHVRVLSDHSDVAMVFGPMRIWAHWGEGTGPGTGPVQSLSIPANVIIPPPELVPYLLSGRNDPQGVVVRRSAMEAIGGYEESIHLYEDMTLYCKVALRHPTLVIPHPTYWYRLNPDSFCSTARAEGRIDSEHLEFLGWLDRYLDGAGVAHAGIRRAIDRARWRIRHPKLRHALDLPWRIRQSIRRRLAE